MKINHVIYSMHVQELNPPPHPSGFTELVKVSVWESLQPPTIEEIMAVRMATAVKYPDVRRVVSKVDNKLTVTEKIVEIVPKLIIQKQTANSLVSRLLGATSMRTTPIDEVWLIADS